MITTLLLSIFSSPQSEPEQCKPIPKFSARGTDGKTYTQASFTAKPAIIVFLKSGCPSLPEAAKDFISLKRQLGTQVLLIGISDGTVDKNRAEVSKFKLNFPILADPGKKLIHALGGQKSLDMGLTCAQDCAVATVTNGYSRQSVEGLIKALPKHGGPKLKVNLAGFPTSPRSGCSL